MKIGLIITGLVVIGCVVVLLLRKPKLVDKSLATYTGRVAEYKGSKKLIVCFTASWASFWALTAAELAKIDREKFDLCIVDASADQQEVRAFGISFFPTVALIENGQIAKRAQNLSSIEQLRDW